MAKAVKEAEPVKDEAYFASVKARLMDIVETQGLRRRSRKAKPIRMIHPIVIFEALDLVAAYERQIGHRLPEVNVPESDYEELSPGEEEG